VPPAELKRRLQVINRGAVLNSLEHTLHVDHELDDIFPFLPRIEANYSACCADHGQGCRGILFGHREHFLFEIGSVEHIRTQN
jgi:hypothetical protein